MLDHQYSRVVPVFILSLFLLGCSGSNPLDGPDHETRVKDLLAASQYAEQTLKLGDPPYRGYFYELCMKNKKKGKVCQDLYSVMLKKLRRQKVYQNVTLSNLTDKRMWLHIRDDYFNDRFDQI